MISLTNSKIYPTKIIGYHFKMIKILAIYTLFGPNLSLAVTNIKQIDEPISFSCENTRQVNGAFNNVLPIQKIKISKSKVFDQFIASNNTNDDFIYLKNSKIYSSKRDENKFIDLLKVEKMLKSHTKKNYTLWLDFDFTNSSSQMNISPLFQNSTVTFNHKLPNAKIFFFNEQTPISKSLGLPKNAKYIEAGPIYKEYNYNYDMINRIARTVNSAYLYDAISCLINKDLDFSNVNLTTKNFEDVTFNFNQWPKEFYKLKQSIAQIIFDSFLKGDINVNILQAYRVIFEDINISKLALESTVNLHHLNNSQMQKITDFINTLPPKDSTELVYRFFNKDEMIGTEVVTLEIDKSKRAKTFKAYNSKKNIDQSLLTHVTLTKDESGNFYFYFHSNGAMDHYIGIGPIDFKKLYWRDSPIAFNSCTERTMKHFNEYERKAFLFYAKKDLRIKNFSELQKLSEYQKYPLEEFIITNNCRGAGNIEFEWPGIVKGYFQIPTPIMENIIDNMTDSPIKFDDLNTEIRLTKFYSENHKLKSSPNSIKNYLLSIWSKYKEEDYKWIRFNDTSAALGECRSEDIQKNLIDKDVKVKNLNFTYEMGKINYSEFLGETRVKSGHLGEKDPIVYTKTPCNDQETKIKIPFSLTSPRHKISTPIKDYWNNQTCEIIPYRFDTYADLLKYPVHLSKFEVDGVYTGQSVTYEQFRLSEHDLTLLKNKKERILFDFKKVYSFKNLQVLEKDDFLTFIFSSEDKKFNFIIGNINKKNLNSEYQRIQYQSYARPWANDSFRGIYSLIGINPFGLSNFYNADNTDERPVFSYTFDNNGKILNHHEPSIGIEQWYLRKTKDGLQLDILSHERITPVARIFIKEDLSVGDI